MTEYVQSVPLAEEVEAPAPAAGGFPEGTSPDARVPVRQGDSVYTVPVSSYQAALDAGGVPLSPEEWAAHQEKRAAEKAASDGAALQQKLHGDLTGQLEAASSKALETVPLVGPLVLGVTPESVKEELRQAQAANPGAAKLGAGVGYAAQLAAALFSGGTSAEAEALGVTGEGAEAAGALANGAAGKLAQAAQTGAVEAQAAQAATEVAPSIAQRVAQTIALPQNAVSSAGAAVGRGVQKLLGDEASTLAGRLAARAAVVGSTGAAEGAVYGGNDYLNELALSKDPEFDGEKLVHAVGAGMLFGGVTGGLLGAGEEAAGALATGTSKALQKLPGELGIRAILGGRSSKAVAALDRVGGAGAVGDMLIKRGVITAGEGIETIAPKAAKLAEEYGAAVGALRDEATAAGAEGVPVAEVVGHYNKEIASLEKSFSPQDAVVARIRSLRDRFVKNLGVDSEAVAREIPEVNEAEIRATVAKKFLEEAPTLQGVHPEELFESAAQKAVDKAEMARLKEVRAAQDAAVHEAVQARAKVVEEAGENFLGKTVNFRDLATARKSLDEEINYARDPFAKDIPKEQAFLRIRSGVEESLEKGLDKADKVFKGDLLKRYQTAKLDYRRSAVANELASRAAAAKQGNSTFGLSTMLAGSAASHLAAGPMGIVSGLAGAVANKVIRERGMSTAAVLADKIATLTAIRRASSRIDQQVARGVDGILEGRAPNAAGAPDHGLKTFGDKAKAVLAAEADPQGHLEGVQRAVQGMSAHAPRTAAAFVSTAVRATQYLASILPRAKPVNPLVPKGPKIEPSQHEQYVFSKAFDAVHYPPSVLADVAKGTVIPQQVAALKATAPKMKDHMDKSLTRLLEKETAPVGYKQALPVSMFLGSPASPTLGQQSVAMLQAGFAAPPKTQAPAKKPETAGSGHGIPKASRLQIAANTSLDASRFR